MKRLLVTAAVLALSAAGLVAAVSSGVSRRKDQPAPIVDPAELNARGMERIVTAQNNLTASLEALRVAQEQHAGKDAVAGLRRDAARRRSVLQRAYEDSARDFLAAADRNDNDACYNLGVCCLYGYGVVRDEAKAFRYLERAADNGHAAAQGKLGVCYRDGIGCEADSEAAIARFAEGAKGGDAFSEMQYALALISGRGVAAADEAEGMKYLRRAADKRLVEAMDVYAQKLMDLVGFVKARPANASEEARSAAERKDEAEIARWRRDAIGYWCHCAMNLQYAPSMVRLAKCYRDGTVVARNERLAVYWFYRAAMDYDDVEAMAMMADCCEKETAGLKREVEVTRRDGTTVTVNTRHWWLTRADKTNGEPLARRMAAIWLSEHGPHLFDRLDLPSAAPAP